MLHGENFGGRHQRDLIAVFDDDGGGFRATMVLPLPTSPSSRRFMGTGRSRSAAISREDALLRLGGLEGQDALDALRGCAVRARGRRCRVAAAACLAAQGEAQLVEEKFLEDEPPVRGGAELVERFERDVRRREMHEAQGVAARREIRSARSSSAGRGSAGGVGRFSSAA